MAKSKPHEHPTRENGFVSVDEINQGIAKLRRRITQVEELKKDGIPYRDALRATAEVQIKETIREIFGAHSPEYHDHQHYRIKATTKAEIAAALAMLEGLIARLEDKILEKTGVEKSPSAAAPSSQIEAPTPTPTPVSPAPPRPRPTPSPQAHPSQPSPAPAASIPPVPSTGSYAAVATVPPSPVPLSSTRSIPRAAAPTPAAPPMPVSRPVARESASSTESASATDDQRWHALEIIRKVCTRFHTVARQLRQRGEYRATLEVEDEHDVRDVVQALLYLDFDDIRTEEWMPSYADGTSRMDLVLKREGIVIVIKKTRQGLGAREVADQFSHDSQRYADHPDCKILLHFIYDPEGRIGNPRRLEADLTQARSGRHIEILISPK